MNKKSLVKSLLEEEIEFCYTQEQGIYGITKNSVIEKYGKCIPKDVIDMLKEKHGVDTIYSSIDTIYMYLKEIK